MKMNSNYEVYESNYEEYLLNNGLQSLGSKIEQDVKNNNARYYVIKKNDKLYTDFALYPNDNNLITLDHIYLKYFELVNTILESLSDYEYISIHLFYQDYHVKEYKLIKENFQVVKEIDLMQGISNCKQVCFKIK